ASSWRDWAGSDDFLRPLSARLARLGVGGRAVSRRVDTATADPGWPSLARLDAAVRLVDAVAGAGGVRRGREALKVLDSLLAPDRAIPDRFWSVRPAPTPTAPDDDDEGHLLFRG